MNHPRMARRLDLIPAPAAEVCVVCRRAADDGAEAGDFSSIVACERCGAMVHGAASLHAPGLASTLASCYWSRVATADERRAFWQADEADKAEVVSACTPSSAPRAARERHAPRGRRPRGR